jgi:IMP cyclohydrolase
MVEYDASTPEEAAQYIFNQGVFKDFEHPVSSVASIYDGNWNTVALSPKL